MRIAFVNRTCRKVGGIETYLDVVLPGLDRRGVDVALLHEIDRPGDRQRLSLSDDAPTWCVEGLGAEVALRRLRDWRPDVIYAHSMRDMNLEPHLTSVAPVFLFAHEYHGTCVGGAKTWKFPRPVPCSRKFGRCCLLHYYPHRCGGWNPLTMLREYRNQDRGIRALGACEGILTHSEHMRREYLRHGFPPERVRKIPFPIAGGAAPIAPERPCTGSKRLPSNLLFLGRMDRLKGGDVLIDAAASAATELARPLTLTFAGDGPERPAWESKAKRTQTRHGNPTTSFAGWVSSQHRDRLLTETDLLVVPSLWPEPFGMVGIEAGMFGVPSAAFAVGGIPEWLHDGENGHLAPGRPPTARGLAQTIVRCLKDPAHYDGLCAGALAASRHYTVAAHLDALLEVFSLATDRGDQR